MKNRILILVIILACSTNVFAQNKAIDSLENVLKQNTDARAKLNKIKFDKSDSTRLNILNVLSKELLTKGKLDKCKTYADEALNIATTIGFKKPESEICLTLGTIAQRKGDYTQAVEYYSKAKAIAEKLGYNLVISKIYNNVGIISIIQGNYPEAVKQHFAALKIREEMKDRKGMADSYNNLGIVYQKMKNIPDAIKHQKAALKIREEIGDRRGLINSYTNLANLLDEVNDSTEILKYYFASLKISQELQDEVEIAKAYDNISIIYYMQHRFSEAKNFNDMSRVIERALDNKYGLCKSYLNAAFISYFGYNNYDEAKKHLDTSIGIAKEIESASLIKEYYHNSYLVDSGKGNWSEAYKNFSSYIYYRDSFINEENTKKIVQTEMQYEFDKKEAATKLEQQQKDLALQKELALKALQVEYEKKQAAAKSEKEKQQLKFEQQIKEQQINFEYNQKIAQTETEKKQQTALNKMLSAENTLMTENSKNEKKVRWLMIVALLGFTAFGINYYRNYKRQKADNRKIIKQAEDLKTLMKEVHHRVKNNLQMIVAMLRMQARVVEDKAAIEALVNSENRLQAIAIVHEKLYKGDNFSNVFLKDYLQELMDILVKQNYNPNAAFQFTITDNTQLTTSLDTAIPLGLIVNELVTNSFKYVSGNVANAVINLAINKLGDKFELTIQDNGAGLPNGELPKNPKSLGLRLVNLFTEQLNGTLKYFTKNGACFVITF